MNIEHMTRLFHWAHVHKALREGVQVHTAFRRTLDEAPLVGVVLRRDARSFSHVIARVVSTGDYEGRCFSVANDGAVFATGPRNDAELLEMHKRERL